MSKRLISYFSASGVTKTVAEHLSKKKSADLFEIEPVQKYTEEDLNWMDKNSRSSIEMSDKNSRPEVANKVDNIDSYDTVIIGFPVWWYIAPTIINTFIEENNLEGKNILVFVTSGGSGVSQSYQNLKEQYPNLNFVASKRIADTEDEDAFVKMIEEF